MPPYSFDTISYKVGDCQAIFKVFLSCLPVFSKRRRFASKLLFTQKARAAVCYPSVRQSAVCPQVLFQRSQGDGFLSVVLSEECPICVRASRRDVFVLYRHALIRAYLYHGASYQLFVVIELSGRFGAIGQSDAHIIDRIVIYVIVSAESMRGHALFEYLGKHTGIIRRRAPLP